MNFIIALVLGAITGILVFVATLISEDFGGIVSILMSVVSGIYSLAVMIPFITLAVRRLHDTGKSGMVYLLCALGTCCCGIGSIVLFVFMCIPGDQGDNQYGPDPKMVNYNNSYVNTNNNFTGM